MYQKEFDWGLHAFDSSQNGEVVVGQKGSEDNCYCKALSQDIWGVVCRGMINTIQNFYSKQMKYYKFGSLRVEMGRSE